MDLLTNTQFEKLLANGRATAEARHNGKDGPDHFPVVKLFNPGGKAIMLLSEIDPADNDSAFGLSYLGWMYPELGRVSFHKIEITITRIGLPIKRDRHWTATHSISVYARAASKAGCIVTDRASLDAAAAEVK